MLCHLAKQADKIRLHVALSQSTGIAHENSRLPCLSQAEKSPRENSILSLVSQKCSQHNDRRCHPLLKLTSSKSRCKYKNNVVFQNTHRPCRDYIFCARSLQVHFTLHRHGFFQGSCKTIQHTCELRIQELFDVQAVCTMHMILGCFFKYQVIF